MHLFYLIAFIHTYRAVNLVGNDYIYNRLETFFWSLTHFLSQIVILSRTGLF